LIVMTRNLLSNRINWRLRGFSTQKTLNLLEESQWWAKDRMQEFRNARFRDLIGQCYEHVPYYRDVMNSRGLAPHDFATLADLPKLPVLTKEQVRQNLQRLWADNIPASKLGTTRTGGTTGEPMRIRKNMSSMVWSTMCMTRGFAWSNLLPNMRRARLFGGSLGQHEPKHPLRALLKKWLGPKETFLPAFELRPDNARQYIEKIRAGGNRHLIGYASACYLLACFAEEAGATLNLEAVFPTAELLLDEWADKIANVFSCKVLPYYGCGEVNSLGYSCGQGQGYHRCDEHTVMEVQLADGRTSFEGAGAFLLTDLNNYAMPIVRYQNDDAGVLTDEPCPCGRTLGRILRLDGRVNDMLLTCDGNRISGVIATHAFRYVQGARLYQFVQSSPGQIKVRIVPNEEFDRVREETRISGILQEHLGAGAAIEFEYPDDVERTPAGKARFVINRYLKQPASRSQQPTSLSSDTDPSA